MLRAFFIAALLISFDVQSASADPKNAQGPEYIGNFVAIIDGKSVPLEQQQLTAGVKSGFFSGKTFAETTGEHSKVRFPAGAPIVFVVRVESQNVDPQSLYKLLTMTSNKGRRQVVVANIRAFSGVHDNLGEASRAFNASKYGNDFFKITMIEPLPKGEYVFANIKNETNQQTANFFGID